MNQEIFKDLLVVELAGVLAGPSVGMFLAELGARVIKVENPRTKGDVTRSWKLPLEDKISSISAYYSSINWGKESICLDLFDSNDIALLNNILSKADVVLTSFKKGDDVKFGLDYESIKKFNEKIVYASITGYGEESEKVGYDAIIQAESGFTYLNGNDEFSNHKMPVALVDVLAAHQLKQAVLLALYERKVSNIGQKVSISLYEAAVSSLVNVASNFLNGNSDPKPQGSEHPNIVPYGTQFLCKDGKQVVLAIGTDKQFEAFMSILNLEIAPEFQKNQSRVENRTKLNQIISNKLVNYNSDEIVLKLSEKNIPVGIVKTIFEVMNDEKTKTLIYDGNIKGLKSNSIFSNKISFSEPPILDVNRVKIVNEFSKL